MIIDHNFFLVDFKIIIANINNSTNLKELKIASLVLLTPIFQARDGGTSSTIH